MINHPVDSAIIKYHLKRDAALNEFKGQVFIILIPVLIIIPMLFGLCYLLQSNFDLREKAAAYEAVQQDLAAFTAVVRED